MKYLTYSDLQKVAIKSHGLLKVNGNEATITWIDGNVGFRNYAIGIDGKELTFADFRLFIKETEAKEVLQLEKIDTRILNNLEFDEVEELLNDIPSILIIVDDKQVSYVRSTSPMKYKNAEFDEMNGFPTEEHDYWDMEHSYTKTDVFTSIPEMEEVFKVRWDALIDEAKSNKTEEA